MAIGKFILPIATVGSPAQDEPLMQEVNLYNQELSSINIDARLYYLSRLNLMGQTIDIRGNDVRTSESDPFVSTLILQGNEVLEIPIDEELEIPIDETLVGHWTMDDDAGTVLMDSSGNENHADVIGDINFKQVDAIGNSIYMTSTQYASVPANEKLDIVNEITITGFFRPQSKNTQTLVKKAVNGITDGYEIGTSSTGVLLFRINQASNGNTYRLDSISQYPDNGFSTIHVAATYDGNTMKIYIDGILDNSKVIGSVPIATNNLPLTIGAEVEGAAGYRGWIDDVRLYNRALSDEEINDIANLSTFPPIMITPPNQTAGVFSPVNFAWGSIENAVAYHIQISEDSLFTNILFDKKVIETSISRNLPEDKTYYWRIRAFIYNIYTDWSSFFTFNMMQGAFQSVILENIAYNNLLEQYDSTLQRPQGITNGSGMNTVFSTDSDAYVGDDALKLELIEDGTTKKFHFGDFPTIAGHIHYIGFWMKSNILWKSVRVDTGDGRNEEIKPPHEVDTYEWCSMTCETFESGDMQFSIELRNDSMAVQIGDWVLMSGFMNIDLTECFGEGNEPTMAEMDLMIRHIGHFSSTYQLTQTVDQYKAIDDVHNAKLERHYDGIIRVATWNMVNMDGYPKVAERVIIDADVDILAAQETYDLTTGSTLNPAVSSFHALVNNLNMTHWYYQYIREESADWQFGRGNAAANIINNEWFSSPQQGVLKSTIRILGRDISFYNQHLPASQPFQTQINNVQALYNLVSQDTNPYIIVIGDFNTPAENNYDTLFPFTDNGYTSAQGLNDNWLVTHLGHMTPVDNVLIKSDVFEFIEVVPKNRFAASDHDMLRTEIKFKNILPDPIPNILTPLDSLSSMAGVSSDLSGITYNPLTNTLFNIVNTNIAIREYDLEYNLLRTIPLTGFEDTEGITWMYGNTFAVCQERTTQKDIVIFNIEALTTTIDKSEGVVILPNIPIQDNSGMEGITYDVANKVFYVAVEKGQDGSDGGRVYSVNPVNGHTIFMEGLSQMLETGNTDLSDLFYDNVSERLYILSDESKKVTICYVDGGLISVSSVSEFTQPEGIVVIPHLNKVIVVGETNEIREFEID